MAVPPTSAETGQGTAALTRGATIGRYVVLGLVGRGGMGEVYAAYDPELDRKVALKLLRVKPGNGVSLTEGRQRTLREAQAIARLSHPNVVVVYDVGTFRDQVFIAMEFVEGNTVTYWLQAQPRSWQEVLKVFMAAGRGLQAAHEKGLVHRDFKPDNVMVGRDGEVRVMDFGLARQVNERSAASEPHAPTPKRVPVVDPEHPTEPMPAALPVAAVEGTDGGGDDVMSTILLNGGVKVAVGEPLPSVAPGAMPTVAAEVQSGADMFGLQLTRTGAMMGTPAYMAPEQFLGTATDARTDQFSFCVALYEALYGERPFGGNTMFALTSNVVQGNVREAPASSKVPLWVRKVLLRALRPVASERWPSMEALLVALTNNPSTTRRKWAVAAVAVLLPVGLAFGVRQTVIDHKSVCGGGLARLAGVWDLQAPGEPEPARRTRIKSAFLATGKSYAADAFGSVSRILTNYAQSWANMYRESCEATQVRGEQSAEVLDLRMSCLQERLGGLRALTDVFTDANGQVVENAVSAANALGPLDRCADVPLLRAVVRPPEDPATRARVADLRARLTELKARFDAGRWKEVMAGAPPLVAEARALGYQPLMAESLALLGTILYKSNETRASEQALVEAFWAADASRHDEVRAEVASSLVFVIGYQEGRFAEAKRWGNTADAVLRRLGGHELLRAWLLTDLGTMYYLEGDKEASLAANERSVALKEKALGPDHPDVGISEGNLAIALQLAGRDQEALTHVDRSIALLENGLGAGHPELAVQLSNRGETLNALGRYREARQSFERARIIWERELGLENLNLAYALTGIGISYLAENNPASALVPLERAFKIREAQETDQGKRGETRFALARALWDANRDRVRARTLAEEARESFAKTAAKTNVAEIDSWLVAHGRT